MLAHFIDLVFPPRESELLVRSIKDVGLVAHLEPHVRSFGSRDIVTLLPYEEPIVRACIVEAAFHGSDMAAKALGVALAIYLQEEVADREQYEHRTYRIVPVPLSHERFRERGYNQAEVIARHAQIELRQSEGNAIPNVELHSEILIRICDAFGIAHAPDPSVTYILLDDVVTSDATIGEAVRALEDAGATDVWTVALAH